MRNKVKRNRLVVAMIKRHPGGTKIQSKRDKNRNKKFDWRAEIE
jgi:hypothetical protein